MIRFTLFLLYLVFPSTLLASCFDEHIEIEILDADHTIRTEGLIRARIRNIGSEPIGGVWIDFEIWAEGRPQPIGDESFVGLRRIDGALMPGEELIEERFTFLSDRAEQMANNSTRLSVVYFVENMADGQMRSVLRYPKMRYWSDTEAPVLCRP